MCLNNQVTVVVMDMDKCPDMDRCPTDRLVDLDQEFQNSPEEQDKLPLNRVVDLDQESLDNLEDQEEEVDIKLVQALLLCISQLEEADQEMDSVLIKMINLHLPLPDPIGTISMIKGTHMKNIRTGDKTMIKEDITMDTTISMINSTEIMVVMSLLVEEQEEP